MDLQKVPIHTLNVVSLPPLCVFRAKQNFQLEVRDGTALSVLEEVAAFEQLLQWLTEYQLRITIELGGTDSDYSQEEVISAFEKPVLSPNGSHTFTHIRRMLDRSLMVVSARGYIGIAPAGTKIGDHIRVLQGARCLHTQGTRRGWQLLNDRRGGLCPGRGGGDVHAWAYAWGGRCSGRCRKAKESTYGFAFSENMCSRYWGPRRKASQSRCPLMISFGVS